MATTTQLGYGINGISQADLDFYWRSISSQTQSAVVAEYKTLYGANWYPKFGEDTSRVESLYLAATSDDARLASLASNPTPDPATPGAFRYSKHDINRWRTMGATAFQSWLATVTSPQAANYYAQVSGYKFSIVTPGTDLETGDPIATPPPVVSGTPEPYKAPIPTETATTPPPTINPPVVPSVPVSPEVPPTLAEPNIALQPNPAGTGALGPAPSVSVTRTFDTPPVVVTPAPTVQAAAMPAPPNIESLKWGFIVAGVVVLFVLIAGRRR